MRGHVSCSSIGNPSNRMWGAMNALDTSRLRGPRCGSPAVSLETIHGLKTRLLVQLFPPNIPYKSRAPDYGRIYTPWFPSSRTPMDILVDHMNYKSKHFWCCTYFCALGIMVHFHCPTLIPIPIIVPIPIVCRTVPLGPIPMQITDTSLVYSKN